MKKIFLAVIVIALIVSSCKTEQNNQQQLNKLTKELKEFQSEKETLANNKKVVINFYQEFFGNKDLSAADKYIGDVYIQHNPMVADGKEALVTAAKGWFKDSAEKEKINFLNVVAQDDLVFAQIVDTFPNGNKNMVIDVFRVTNGKITEHWDAFAQFKKGDKSANPNPLF